MTAAAPQVIFKCANQASDCDGLQSSLGPNGVGKTAFLKCLNDIINVRTGTTMVEQQDLLSMCISDIAKQIGYVPLREGVDPGRT